MGEPELEEPQIAEVGGTVGGERLTLDRRLYIQLLAFGNCADSAALVGALESARIPAVVYEDVNDPEGVAVAAAFEEPKRFLTELRPVLLSQPFSSLRPKPELTMFGRTYAMGYERDLEYSLLRKPAERLSNPDMPWAVWYPLRRKGAYETLDAEQQREIQQEHMKAGFSFARAGHIADIRLACHGMGQADNDFIVGLLGPELHPLSLVIQLMRKSKQTALYLERLGPFFLGRVAGRTIEAPVTP